MNNRDIENRHGEFIMGPLEGIKVVEIASIGPGPMCAMLLSDLGATVLRVDRASAVGVAPPMEPQFATLQRGRQSIGVDLKNPEGVETVLQLVDGADALIEGFRPGVTERLGIGPDDCFERNPKLVYGRMTGWGQDGPMAQAAAHDINYIALTGALHAIGTPETPVPPLNLVADFGGGGVYLAFGVVSALVEAMKSGKGQVVDAAMVDGASSLMASCYGGYAAGAHLDERGVNRLDGGCHHYNVYETSDGKFISVGSNEPQFYALLIEALGLDLDNLPAQADRTHWPEMKARIAAIFKTKTRAEWCEQMEGSDICFAPVLSLAEAPEHPHMKARGTFVEVDGVVQPGPAPRFSRTPGAVQGPPAYPGQHTDEGLSAWGLSDDRIAELRKSGAVA
jgi:alpha-methylacyl-CoA racemase